MYSNCPTICADGPKESIRVCAKCGGPGADFGNSVKKTGPVVAGPDCPTTRKSVDLPTICAGDRGCPRYMSIDIL
jgi:hypothetical protein